MEAKEAGRQSAEEIKREQNDFFSRSRQSFQRAFSPRKITKEISLIAFSDMADYVQVDAEGSVKPISFSELKKGASRVIKKIREKRRILSNPDGNSVLEDTFEFELYDKLEALKMGSELAGLKVNRLEVSGKNGEAILIEDARQKLLDKVSAIAGRTAEGGGDPQSEPG